MNINCLEINFFRPLDRMIPPRIRMNLINNSYLHVEDLNQNCLTCFAEGYPNPIVRWIRGSVESFKLHYLSFE